MKKYLVLLLIALMISVLFISVACSDKPEEQEEETCLVTFNTQGGSEIAPVSVKTGFKVSKPKTDPTKEGYVFFGWYKNAACTTAFNFKAAVIGDVTIYAKWIAESDLGKVTLNYNYNNKTDVVWAELNKVATIETPTRKGYIFLGWFEDAAFTESKKFDVSSTITKNVDLYAKWISQTDYELSDPILPTGTGVTIPTQWSSNPKGYEGLPAIKYNFSGTVTNETNVTEELKAAIEYTKEHPEFFDETPTKILFVFSDGWGVTEVKMSREYKGELILDSLPYATESMTDSYNKYSHDGNNDDYSGKTTTDSPAGGTQVLAGYKTRYGYISLDVDGNIITNLSEAAKEKGWYVACVTNDNIVDATPADAIIHDTNRYHSDVLYYKALMATDWDLLMGWDWGMDTYFNGSSWESRLLEAAKEGIKDANERESTGTLSGTPIAFFKKLSTANKAKVAPFLIYYTLWENEDPSRLNSWQRWTRGGEAELNAFLAWLDSDSGLKAAISKLDSEYGNPSTHVNRYTDFANLVNNTDFSKPVLGSWKSDGANYEAASPNRGYLLHGEIAQAYPSWPEMVAYTIYQLDSEAGVDGGFFAMIENTCTDGWGHSGNQDTKVQGMMNEVQCFDEGVAIAVKYVLEHPDTLLVISADHETGGFELRDGWATDFTKIKSTTTGHSSQNVPLYAFGAGAQNFSAEAIAEKFSEWGTKAIPKGGDGSVHEGWITGALMGELITGEPFGEPKDYKGK